MTSIRRWNSHSEVNKHPDESTLLAYLRGQKLEARVSVREHVERDKCPECLHKLKELEQVSTVLEGLAARHSQHTYPEFTVAETYARIERLTHEGRYGQRPRTSAVRLISIPVAFGLAILFTMTVLVFANLSNTTFNPFSFNRHTSSGTTILTVVVPAQTAPTQHPKVAATNVGTPVAIPGAKAPYIKVCSTQANIAQLQLAICGFSFDSMHKAYLLFYAPGKGVFWLRNITVDLHGNFYVVWNITDCRNLPISIYGYEATSSTPIRASLHIKSFGACIPSQTPVVKPSMFSPNLGF